eukprot:TRINITY_DN429_c0_g1_i1.p1 TRINITY_DN429_c0_g1~~TRINITY_DN429_c0_g1_i1.p1  ORF type:complete len:622 (+),score=203.11 TRINITY_DN429_c0_g1_i1:291-2156(+)
MANVEAKVKELSAICPDHSKKTLLRVLAESNNDVTAACNRLLDCAGDDADLHMSDASTYLDKVGDSDHALDSYAFDDDSDLDGLDSVLGAPWSTVPSGTTTTTTTTTTSSSSSSSGSPVVLYIGDSEDDDDEDNSQPPFSSSSSSSTSSSYPPSHVLDLTSSDARSQPSSSSSSSSRKRRRPETAEEKRVRRMFGSDDAESDNDDDDEDDDQDKKNGGGDGAGANTQKGKGKKKARVPSEVTIQKRIEREAERARKKEEKEKAKRDKARQKDQLREEKKRLAEEERVRKERLRKERRKPTKDEQFQEVRMMADVVFGRKSGGAAIMTHLKELQFHQSSIEKQAVDGAIVWQRRVPCDDDDDDDGGGDGGGGAGVSWVDEKFVSFRILADEFIAMVGGIKDRLLSTLLRRIHERYPGRQVTFIIEGMTKRLKARSTQLRKVYADAEKAGPNSHDAALEAGFRRIPHRTVGDAEVKAAISWLYIDGDVSVRQLSTPRDTADYLHRFTRAIAEAPYRQKSSYNAFVAATMSKHVNQSLTETYVTQLAQIPGCTIQKGLAIKAHWPTLRNLLEFCCDNTSGETPKAKQKRLADIMVGKRRLGPVLALKIYTLYTSTDGNALLRDS